MNGKLRSFIAKVRVRSGNPNSAPAVTATFMSEFLPDTLLDPTLYKPLMATGFGHMTRVAMKEATGPGDTPAQMRLDQLNQWAEDYRPIVQAIGVGSLYVPSRKEFAPLNPDELSESEYDEAGHHLKKHGRDCIARGESVHELKRLLFGTAKDMGNQYG